MDASTGIVSGTVGSSANTSSPYSVTVTATDSVVTSVSASQSFAVRFAQDHGGHLLHNYGAIASLEHLLDILDPRGFIVINDYGQTELKDHGEFEHQRFSNATFVGINFPLLKAFFADAGGKSWLGPVEDSGRIIRGSWATTSLPRPPRSSPSVSARRRSTGWTSRCGGRGEASSMDVSRGP